MAHDGDRVALLVLRVVQDAGGGRPRLTVSTVDALPLHGVPADPQRIVAADAADAVALVRDWLARVDAR